MNTRYEYQWVSSNPDLATSPLAAAAARGWRVVPGLTTRPGVRSSTYPMVLMERALDSEGRPYS